MCGITREEGLIEQIMASYGDDLAWCTLPSANNSKFCRFFLYV